MDISKSIKVSEDLIRLVQNNGLKVNSTEENYVISKGKASEILQTIGFCEHDNIELNDFFEFSKFFGFDREKYILLKPLKEQAKVTWKDIKNIRYGDIDFENSTISFKHQSIKYNNKKELGR